MYTYPALENSSINLSSSAFPIETASFLFHFGILLDKVERLCSEFIQYNLPHLASTGWVKSLVGKVEMGALCPLCGVH
jgi:hypothetical protein